MMMIDAAAAADDADSYVNNKYAYFAPVSVMVMAT
jgi:hypothetical protein